MARTLKLSLLAVLLLTLPLRAVAGVAMLSCMAHHAGMAVAVTADMGAADHCAQASEHAPTQPSAKFGAECTLCGDCCVAGAALPILVAVSPLLPSNDGPPVIRSSAYPGFEPDGPERPPRSTSH